MGYTLTVSRRCAEQFIDADAEDGLLVVVAGNAWMVDSDYYKKYLPGAFVIMHRADLDDIAPDARDYSPEHFAAMVTDLAADVIPEGPEPRVFYRCPVCWERVRRGTPTSLTPGLSAQRWCHRDGEALCPVMGPGGYVPADPVPAFC